MRIIVLMEKFCTKYINKYGQLVRSNGKEKRDLVKCLEWSSNPKPKIRYGKNKSFR